MAIVAVVAIPGLLVGHVSDRFLTCENATVAGDGPASNRASFRMR
ncbi:hypothetical protein ACIBPB_03590 [Micromonospora sp. NPDC049836]